jgi:cytochrome c oxidase subunit III
MQKRYSDELDPAIKLKMKKNLIYVSIFSIVMIFAGFTSAYIVSMGDTFWVKYPLPLGFWISTILIATSSLTYIVAIKFSQKGDFKKLKVFMVLTFLLGIGFVISQWKGYGQLVDKGANFRNSILVTEGRYGDYFEIKYQDKFIEVNGNDYLLGGKNLTQSQLEELKSFVKPFEKTANPKGYSIQSLSPKFTLYYQGELVRLENNKLKTISGKELKAVEMRRLQYLAWNIRDNRGDFFYKGKLGKDFHIFYKGKELRYEDRNLYFGKKILSPPLQLKINQARDTATSYLYIITILHLLHVLAAIIYLFRMVLITFKSSLTADNQLSIKLGGIFWHFLGILWLYLLVFLLFIH